MRTENSVPARLALLGSACFGLVCLLASALHASGQSRTVLTSPLVSARKKPAHVKPAEPAPVPMTPIPVRPIAALATGFPLRVQLDHRYRMRIGTVVQGKLLDPVYAGDHIVLPIDSIVTGRISALTPIERGDHTWALLDGDVTPLKTPVLTFDSVRLPGGQELGIDATGTERTAGVVKMTGVKKKQSLMGKAKAMFEARKKAAADAIHSHHKSDTALQMVYGQLPYHPQDIWAGTQFDAELTKPVTVPDPKAARPLPLKPPNGHLPPGTLDARLTTDISSATDRAGDKVEAVLTKPYFDANASHVILPTGTRLMGVVTQAKPARKLGRNGTLRFTFRQIILPQGALEQVHAQLTSVEGQKGQNISVDSEGGAHANSGPGKVLDPLVLGALAGNSLDADQNIAHAGVASNGFGLLGEVGSMVVVMPEVTAGFAYYALGKSITRRWLMRGHEVAFPKDTRLQLAVADR